MKENDKKSVKKVDTKKSSAAPLDDEKMKSVSAGQEIVVYPEIKYEYEKPSLDFEYEQDYKMPDPHDYLKPKG